MSKTHTSNEQKPLASEIICDLEAENAKLEARSKKLSNIVLKQAAVLVETLLLLNEEGDLGNEDAR